MLEEAGDASSFNVAKIMEFVRSSQFCSSRPVSQENHENHELIPRRRKTGEGQQLVNRVMSRWSEYEDVVMEVFICHHENLHVSTLQPGPQNQSSSLSPPAH